MVYVVVIQIPVGSEKNIKRNNNKNVQNFDNILYCGAESSGVRINRIVRPDQRSSIHV